MGARFLEISEQWQERAVDLTRWTAEHLINRIDAWMTFLPVRKRTPDTDAIEATGQLTQKIVGQHYAATKPAQLIGVASHDGQDPSATRFMAIQLIRTGEDDPVRPGQNFQVALDWHERLEDLGFDPILEDADGAGTYRLIVLFDDLVDAAQVAAFGRTVTSDYANQDLHTPPRLVPRPTDTDDFGALRYLRLPGLHPHHEHHSTFWDGDKWLEGAEAIDALLSARATPATFIRKPRPKPAKRVTVEKDAIEQAVTLPLTAPKPDPEPPKALQPAPRREAPTPVSESAKSGISSKQTASVSKPAKRSSKQPSLTHASGPDKTVPPKDYKDAAAACIASISDRTGLREDQIVRRVFAWLAEQDEVVQAVVLDQIPPTVRPNIARQLLEKLAG